MPTSHASLGPSASARWLTCTASVGLIEEVFPDGVDTGGVYAQEGTWAHSAAELAAAESLGLVTNKRTHQARWRRWKKAVPEDLHEEMIDHARSYADELAEIRDGMPGTPIALLEQVVHTSSPEVWGTADCILASDEEIVVVDYKYGRGVSVSPEGNSQLSLYGVGAIHELENLLTDFRDECLVTLVVYQPRAPHGGGAWTTSVGDLRRFETERVIPAVEQIRAGDTRYAPSEAACRWCPAAGMCSAQTEWATRRDFAPTGAMGPGQIAEALSELGGIEDWCRKVREQALRITYEEGQVIPGWKSVLTPGRRSIADHAKAIETLDAAGYPPDQTSRANTETITKLSKLVGGTDALNDLLGDLIKTSSGKHTLVPEDDPRPAATAASGAESDFRDPVPED